MGGSGRFAHEELELCFTDALGCSDLSQPDEPVVAGLFTPTSSAFPLTAQRDRRRMLSGCGVGWSAPRLTSVLSKDPIGRLQSMPIMPWPRWQLYAR
jgi:hypothetical protein